MGKPPTSGQFTAQPPVTDIRLGGRHWKKYFNFIIKKWYWLRLWCYLLLGRLSFEFSLDSSWHFCVSAPLIFLSASESRNVCACVAVSRWLRALYGSVLRVGVARLSWRLPKTWCLCVHCCNFYFIISVCNHYSTNNNKSRNNKASKSNRATPYSSRQPNPLRRLLLRPKKQFEWRKFDKCPAWPNGRGICAKGLSSVLVRLFMIMPHIFMACKWGMCFRHTHPHSLRGSSSKD